VVEAKVALDVEGLEEEEAVEEGVGVEEDEEENVFEEEESESDEDGRWVEEGAREAGERGGSAR
jgi:hypothetical protein